LLTVKKAVNGEEVFFTALENGGSATYADILLNGTTYEAVVVCKDSFGGVTERVYPVECERVELNIAKNKIGIGKYAEIDDLIDCAWPIRVDGDITFTDEQGNEISLRAIYKLLTGQG
jgi:hypothetical protein